MDAPRHCSNVFSTWDLARAHSSTSRTYVSFFRSPPTIRLEWTGDPGPLDGYPQVKISYRYRGGTLTKMIAPLPTGRGEPPGLPFIGPFLMLSYRLEARFTDRRMKRFD